MPTSLRSHAKINLGLAIGPSRPDGFHGLITVYQTLAAHDIVTIEAARAPKNAIRLSSTHSKVPLDARNTAWRMVERVLAALGVSADVHIHIEKRLPVQGGLGAGSANAAAALLALEQELGTALPWEERLRLAGEVGSDVPLFLLGGTILAVGRGEEIYPLPELPEVPCVLALPEIGVSTPQAYRDWDALQSSQSRPKASLTAAPPSATINRLSRSIAGAFGEPYSSGVFSEREGHAANPLLALVRTGIENDFERVVFPQYPLLGEIKRVLVGETALEDSVLYAALSGSGSALFGLYRTESAAEAALDRLGAQGVAGLLTKTLSRDDYWREMRLQ
jgi:4-diphosphocytidyl-2-C-methyl-D-erythritol kinase